MQALPSGYPSDLYGAFEMLKRRARLALEDLKVLAMIESAGELFYLNMAKTLVNPEAKKLMARNGQEERGHAHRMLKAIHLLGDRSFELPAHPENPFVETLAPEIPVNGDVLTMLETAEKDGNLHYQAWADAEPNAEVAKLLRQNGAEESTHGERVAQIKVLLRGN